MVDSVASLTPEERALSADWARDRLRRLKESKRPKAAKVYGPAAMRRPTYEEQMFQSASLPMTQPDIASDQYRDSERRVEEGLPGLRGRGPQADEVSARATRFGAIKALRKTRDQGGPTKDQANDAATEAAAQIARQGYVRIWDGVQLALGGLGLAFFGVPSILFIWPVLGMLVGRFFGGHLMNGAGTFSFRGVSVPRIPPYNVLTLPMILWNALLVVAVAALWVGGIVIVAYILYSVQSTLCTPFGWLIKLFGQTICD